MLRLSALLTRTTPMETGNASAPLSTIDVNDTKSNRHNNVPAKYNVVGVVVDASSAQPVSAQPNKTVKAIKAPHAISRRIDDGVSCASDRQRRVFGPKELKI